MGSSMYKISHANLVEIPHGSKFKFTLVVSQWNKSITDKLFEGCYNALTENGVMSKNISRIGSF